MRGRFMNFLERFETWVLAAVTALVAWVWNNITGRIRDLEKDSIKRKEFDQYTSRVDKRFDEMRDSTIKLFDRIDDLKDTILERRQ